MLGIVSLSRKRLFIFCLAMLLASGLGFCIFVWNATRQAVKQSSETVALAPVSHLSVSTLQPVASHFEPVLNSGDLVDAVDFNGDIFVVTTSALYRYSDGQVKQTWHSGIDFPATKLLTLAVRSGIGTPELWIATESAGLLIYDGHVFRHLLPDTQAARKISALLPLSNGQVLVGTQGDGVFVSDGKSLRAFHPKFTKTQVTALSGDEDNLWIGTRSDGVYFWRGGEARHFLTELPDKQVLSVAFDGSRAWIGTPLGISEFTNGQLSRRLAEGTFAQTIAAQDGKLWIGTVDQGILAIPLAVQKPRLQLSGQSAQNDSATSFARIGGSLVAVGKRGLVDVVSRKQLLAFPENTLASNHITAVHEDSRGRLWIGYFDRGIDLIPASADGSIVHLEDDTIFCINRMKENPADGAMLAATANGLALFDSGGALRQVLSRASGLIASNITDILFQPSAGTESTLAIATPAGVSFYEQGSISSVYAFQGLVNNHVYTLADLDGTLYAGTLGGISTLRRGLVQASFNTANSPLLRQNWITASAIFKKHLFLGTYGSGVIGFDSAGGVHAFPAFAQGRTEINANAMLATDRALYVGTAGKGLAILPAGDDRWQFVSNGLPSLNVTALDQRNSRLYIGTDNGLVRTSENNLLP